jgi:DNA-binding MarR family transcriptional regulator
MRKTTSNGNSFAWQLFTIRYKFALFLPAAAKEKIRRPRSHSLEPPRERTLIRRGAAVDMKNADDREVAGAIAELLEALGRDIVSRGFAGDLNPAQWAALRFVSRANLSARSVTAFARAHRTTTGTATRTVAALVRKGHLLRFASTEDRRYGRLELTAKGEEALRVDPLREVATAIDALPCGQRRALLDALWALQRVVVLEPTRADSTAASGDVPVG